ncbi:MAG: gamma-glutamyl-gamma-aminobutyrate hydrolase, partial [Planctomycetota bacterium]
RGSTGTARCPERLLEALERTREAWFALGTPVHPEADSAAALDIRIFEEFIDGVRTRKGDSLRLVA